MFQASVTSSTQWTRSSSKLISPRLLKLGLENGTTLKFAVTEDQQEAWFSHVGREPSCHTDQSVTTRSIPRLKHLLESTGPVLMHPLKRGLELFWEGFLAVDTIRSQHETTHASGLSRSQLKNLSFLLRGCRCSALFNSLLGLVPVAIFQHTHHREAETAGK